MENHRLSAGPGRRGRGCLWTRTPIPSTMAPWLFPPLPCPAPTMLWIFHPGCTEELEAYPLPMATQLFTRGRTNEPTLRTVLYQEARVVPVPMFNRRIIRTAFIWH